MSIYVRRSDGADFEHKKVYVKRSDGVDIQHKKGYFRRSDGADIRVYSADVTLTDMLNTSNWAAFSGVSGDFRKGPQEDTPRDTNRYSNCLRAIGNGAKGRAYIGFTETAYYYYHFYHGSYGDEKGYSVVDLFSNTTGQHLFRSETGRGTQAEPNGLWHLGADTYRLEFWCADDGQVRCWQADIVNLNPVGSSDTNYLHWFGQTYCSGKNGTYTIAL